MKLEEQEKARRITALKKSSFFKNFALSELSAIAENMKAKEIAVGENILTQGDKVDGLYFVEAGFINIIINNQIVRVNMPPGEVLGEMSCLSSHDIPATASVTAVNKVSVLYIPREGVKPLADQIPKIWEKAWEKLSLRLSYSNVRFSEMLDHTQLISIDKNGIISGEMSQECSKILGIDVSDLVNKRFTDIMFCGDENASLKKDWEDIYSSLFQGGMSISPLLEILPSQTTITKPDGNKICLEFKYLPCGQKDNFNKVHVDIDDITTKKMLELKASKLERDKIVRDKIYEEPDGFINLLHLIDEIIATVNRLIRNSNVDIDRLKRLLHTLKGDAGLYCLEGIQKAAHVMEDLIINIGDKVDEIFIESMVNFEKKCQEAHSFFENMTPELRERLIGTVVSEKLLSSLKSAADANDTNKVRNIIKIIESVPVEKITFGWEQLILRLGKQLYKDIEFEMDIAKDIYIYKASADKLSQTLVHVIRNAVFHGIEIPSEREAAGKTDKGRITFSARKDGNNIKLILSDNGRGIDKDKLLKKAVEKIKSGDVDKAVVDEYIKNDKVEKLLFLPGLSTADSVDNISGRGVGMDAVNDTIAELGGSIKIKSKLGEGTSFVFSVPYR